MKFGWSIKKNPRSKNGGKRKASVAVALALAMPLVCVRDHGPRFLNVLFIGNSYTFTNDLPHMVAQIAESDRDDPCIISVDLSAQNGATLNDTWENGDSPAKLASRQWDYVVVQDHSLSYMTDDGIRRSEDITGTLTEEIRAAHAQPVLYETWARQPGNDKWYVDDPHAKVRLVSHDYMHEKIAENAERIANKFGMLEARVGDRWAAANHDTPPPDLYNPDGSHPSVEGTYLAALVVSAVLTGHSPENVTFAPPSMQQAVARNLRKIAAGD